MKLRSRAIVLSVLFVVTYLILQFVDIGSISMIKQDFVKAAVVSLLFGVGLYWVLGFHVKGMRLITILGYPCYLIFIQSLFLELIVFQNVGRLTEKTVSLFILAVFGLSIYLLILTMNILNVSYTSRIPLVQAAKAANFLYVLFGAYFSFLLILRTGIDVILKCFIFSLVVFFLTLNIFWFKRESTRQLLGETSAVTLIMLSLFGVFLIWPFSVEIAVMVYIIVFYILLGLGLEEYETTSVFMRIEYFVLITIAVFFVLRFAIWGINGSVI